ncbi:MAG: transglycosylase SLT domain-containing protein [Proteobacteria bacterium]|nr:transglycosylase SLT domain-containing protein [Pseudomonadota bacterium]MBU4470520.1 transglycosylase SLT domain-containing protein [Pseudomonadota bacterium]MCG2751356.1 transglycosylase SLT domain-containing protein [Desulfobacteraceae bacterium]
MKPIVVLNFRLFLSKRVMAWMAGCLFLWAFSVFGENPDFEYAASLPSLLKNARISEPLSLCGEMAELDRMDAREDMEKEMILALWDVPQVILWAKRAGRYFPMIEEMLKMNGMPEDLKYVPIVESALKPHAGSSKGAMGFWQFMPATGKNYDLQVDFEKDERRNLQKSTEAAISYLKFLHETFGSWTLALAAYNMGENGLKSEILTQKTNNFYDLYLSLETRNYIFKILAVKCILSNPQKYGFKFSPEDLYKPLETEAMDLNCPEEIPLVLVARALGTTFKTLKELNPELRGPYLAKGFHTLTIPKGSGYGFHEKFNNMLNQWISGKEKRLYVVRPGDNLSMIAERLNVPLPALILWNKMDMRKTIHPGDRLVVSP